VHYYLNVTSGAGGTTSPISAFRPAGSTVTIQATPSAGHTFVSWSGSGPGSYSGPNASATVTMNGNIQETATFQPLSYTLVMQHSAGGSVSPATSTYPYGSVVPILATPSPGYKFDRWFGNGAGSYTGTANPASVTVNGPISQTANFIRTYTLTMVATPGGTIVPFPGTYSYVAGGYSFIQATAGANYTFVSWTGVGPGSYTGSNRTAILIVNGDIVQTATFQPKSYTLTMVAGPGGSVTPSSGTYTYGTLVPIEAIPDPGMAFLSWTGVGAGGYSGTNNPTAITIGGPITQTASFAPAYTLTMASDPGGTVSPAPGAYTFASGATVAIQAYPDPAYAFTGWTGTGPGSQTTWFNPTTVTVSGDISETAHFALRALVPLTMIAGPGGSVTPSSGSYYVGTVLTIFATPNVGWTFSDWVGTGAGSYTGTAAGQTIQILGPITETANFVFPPTWPVTMSAGVGGTVTPPSGPYPNGGTLQILATPSPGYVFKTWGGTGPGSYSGSSNPATITVNGPITEGAQFTQAVPITITTSPVGKRIGVDGVDYISPQAFEWLGSTLHTANVDSVTIAAPGDRDRFTQWSDGIGTAARTIFVPATAQTYTAAYVHEYQLDFQDPPEGTSQPGDGWQAAGDSVAITAVPSPGFQFDHWTGAGSGSYTGTANPAIITMNGPITQAPSFRLLGYEFSISASATDPLVNTDAPTGGVRVLSLWMVCSDAGVSALEADVTGDLPVLGFAPAGGVLNIGTSTALFLAIPGCATTGSLLLGSLIVNDTGGTLCLGPSAANGILGAVDCVTFGASTPQVTGFSSDGTAPCVFAGNACGAAIVADVTREAAPPPPDVPEALVPPATHAFLGARPNPFAGQTELHFAVASPGHVRFSIYDVTGRLVRLLADEDMAAGEHLRSWDGRGSDGSRAAGGVYFVRLEIGSFRQTGRIVLTPFAD
jgi:hypothetical protein